MTSSMPSTWALAGCWVPIEDALIAHLNASRNYARTRTRGLWWACRGQPTWKSGRPLWTCTIGPFTPGRDRPGPSWGFMPDNPRHVRPCTG